MEKTKKYLKILGIIIVVGILVFQLMEGYTYENIGVHCKENENSLEIEVNLAQSMGWFRSYKLYEVDEGIYKLMVKVTPFSFRGKIWPQTIILEEKPESIKEIEFTDGKKSSIVYPNYQD